MAMDVSLKQRLIGAVVLVALAVIFLPLLVKKPAPDSSVSGVSLRMPAEPRGGDTVTEALPLDGPGAAPAGGAVGMPMAVPGQASVPEEDSASPTAPLVAEAAGDFAVDFGNYRNVADADKVIAALRGVGLPGYREKATINAVEVQRVRIGPFADQATAESARIRAGRLSSQVTARVIALNASAPAAAPGSATPAQPAAPAKPAAPATATPTAQTPPPKSAAETPKPAIEAPKPATKPAAPETAAAPPKPPAVEPARTPPASAAGTGFVVQIGAFASAPDATALRDAIRKAGFNAFTDTVPGERGTLTRVRVGPVMTRAEADALKAQVKAKTGKDGMVRPHP